ncbi:histidine kinase [Saccharopolyspora gloriosae]|uniref:histidine kinase n=1 Tax=Saccharopolyspora gloriosae TaxID=455344 RepID=A0A840NA58_9PSEU|nr:histidine kinase [Saccharopolyspora gloriosae]MBB5067721.1 signal transduction histidine kinase [Saccharopolyspora gloriosae]
MSSPWFFGPPARRGLFAVEAVALVVACVADAVSMAWIDASISTTAALLIPPSGTIVALLAVLRRRFPAHVGVLAAAAIVLSLLSTVISEGLGYAGFATGQVPAGAEVVGLSLLVGACCRRLRPRPAVLVAVGSLIALVPASLLRYDGTALTLIAVAAALTWGIALSIGLVLRDADNRRRGELAEVRTGERLRLARELHDLVAFHVSGIVVRTNAARALASNPRVSPEDPVEVYTEIEQAGAEALAAMRRLVGMLRTDDDDSLPHGTGFGEAVRQAAGVHATVDVAADLDEVPVNPELATTAHRIVLEALTNARKHSPDAAEARVTGRREGADFVLVVENDNVPSVSPDRTGSGYGLVGMAERVQAVGGTVQAGPAPGRRWRVTARFPIAPPQDAGGNGQGGPR